MSTLVVHIAVGDTVNGARALALGQVIAAGVGRTIDALESTHAEPAELRAAGMVIARWHLKCRTPEGRGIGHWEWFATQIPQAAETCDPAGAHGCAENGTGGPGNAGATYQDSEGPDG